MGRGIWGCGMRPGFRAVGEVVFVNRGVRVDLLKD